MTMLVLFKRGDTEQKHIVVDSSGKYHGVFPSISFARQFVEETMEGDNPPLNIHIYKAEMVDQIKNTEALMLEDYQRS